MPAYSYRCSTCQHHFEIYLTYQEYGQAQVHCPNCGGEQVDREIHPVRIARSEESRLESLADPGQLSGIEEDPQALGKMMRRMSQELGEEMGPEFDEVVDRLEKGQKPEEIEKDLPDLAAGES
jgi:putative FmdB family regulatory protein